MSRAILCTVGTSLLTNANPSRPWHGWKRGQALPTPSQIEAWLRQAPANASAETSTLHHLDLQPADELLFLASSTTEGKFCADALRGFYKPRLKSCTVDQVKALGYAEHHFPASLRHLVNLAISFHRQTEQSGAEGLFCATGGFKAEIAYLTLVGALLGVEVVYLHETHQQLIRLPKLPLSWNTQLIVDHHPFFCWLAGEARPSRQVEQRLHGLPEELATLLEKQENGTTTLSAAGQLLLGATHNKEAASLDALPHSSKLPSQKTQVSAVPHHRPRNFLQQVEKLCQLPWLDSLRYTPHHPHAFEKISLVRPEAGELRLRLGNADLPCDLLLSTTARDRASCELAARHISRLLDLELL